MYPYKNTISNKNSSVVCYLVPISITPAVAQYNDLAYLSKLDS